MKKVVSILLLTFFVSMSKGGLASKTSIKLSVEGMTLAADVVACGLILKVVHLKGKGGTSLVSYTFLVTNGIKGTQTGDTLCFTEQNGLLPMFDSESYNKGECLVLLDRHPQGFARDGLSCDLYPLATRQQAGSFPIYLSEEGKVEFFSADGFQVLHRPADVVSLCCRTAQAEADHRSKNPTSEPQLAYLAIPRGTNAWNRLGSGSECYLQVPAFLYPESKPSF